jgi:hypothetical protein
MRIHCLDNLNWSPVNDNLNWIPVNVVCFYSRVNELCYLTKQQLDPKKGPFYTGSCFCFYNHLSCHHAAVLQHADILPTLAKKISQEKQARRKRRKTGLQCAGKYHLRKMVEKHARLSSIDA